MSAELLHLGSTGAFQRILNVVALATAPSTPRKLPNTSASILVSSMHWLHVPEPVLQGYARLWCDRGHLSGASNLDIVRFRYAELHALPLHLVRILRRPHLEVLACKRSKYYGPLSSKQYNVLYSLDFFSYPGYSSTSPNTKVDFTT